eukprot:Skav205992  [mRNA]  locus=scaffold2084:93025:103143:+ [translate_table: standard]
MAVHSSKVLVEALECTESCCATTQQGQRSNLLVQQGADNKCRISLNQMATSGTLSGDTPELLKPLLDAFQATRTTMQKEMEQDPVPEISCDEILSTTKWLKSVVQAMNEYIDGFSRLSLSNLSDDELHRNQALARESSRQLTLLFADKSKNFTPSSKDQVMEFGMGSQSKEIRENLSKFKKFLEHFSESKWLGDLVAPEFVQQQKLAVKILNDLQTDMQLSLPGCGKKPETKPAVALHNCTRCGQSVVPGGLCTSCKICVHGVGLHRNACWHGCSLKANYFNAAKTDETDKIISISPKVPSSFYEGLSGGGNGSSDQSLAKMSEALAKAFREDVETRKAAEKELQKKMKFLKGFAESVNEVPEVLRRFLLVRAGSINNLSELKAWVSEEEADEVHKMLEEFRDKVNQEKVLRLLKGRSAASEAKHPAAISTLQIRGPAFLRQLRGVDESRDPLPPGNPFGPGNAIDGDESTFWMPAQVPKAGEPNYITLDMTCPGALGQSDGGPAGDQTDSGGTKTLVGWL